jgi:hypothetical protein
MVKVKKARTENRKIANVHFTGDLISSLKHHLAVEIDIPPLLTIQKVSVTFKRCALDK